MVEINPETQKTRRERLATVIALGASVLVHLFVFIGGLQLYHWVEEEKKKERLMVIRMLRESSPESPPPAPQSARRRPLPEAQVREEGPEPPLEESDVSEDILDDITEADVEPAPPEEEETEGTVSVVTDLPAATFTITGPVEFHGAGTFWTKEAAPAGDYTVTFHPVAGYRTPPIRKKTLAEKGKTVIVGKYTRSTEVKVSLTDVPRGGFEIQRPDGLKLGMRQPGRALFDNLPTGNYTIVFNDVPGYLTPAPQSKSLGKGGRLDFAGVYLPAGGGRERKQEAPKEVDSGLDRRVQMIVKSYPATSVEENFDYIRYPEIIIRRSNFQQGWCQVYLILDVDAGGKISKIRIKRPRQDERERFSQLISTVEKSVRRWQYDDISAEVHVDVRFYVEN